MKKIYLFLAALALLTLTLNAQLDATKKVAQTQKSAPTGKKVDMQLGVAKMALNPTSHRAPARAPKKADRGYVLLNDDCDVSKGNFTSGQNITLSAPWSAYSVQYQTNGYLYIRNGGNLTFTVPNGYNNAKLKFVFQTANNSYGTGTFQFGSYKTITCGTAGQEYECELEGMNAGNTIAITGTCGSANYSPDFSYMKVYVDNNGGGDNPSVTTESVTVHENATETSSYLPVWGYNYDEYPQYNQMLYTAEQLGNLRAGTKIISLTFYPTTTQLFSGGNVTVSLGTTTQNSYSAFEDIVPDDLIEVASITPTNQNYSTTGWTINFSTPFIYNGGNLLVQIETETGTYKSTSFYGTSQSANMGFYTYYNSSGSSGAGWYGALQTFQPKATFTYEGFTGPIHDLSIALSAPSTAGAGTTVDVTATVTNNGDFAENGYTVTVSDGTNIVNITAQEELGIGETATFTVQFATIVDAGGSTVNYTATVACTDDAIADNNSATASTALINLPPPENVAATPGENQTATMTWDAPTITASSVTEGFEDTSMFPEFSLGGITATVHNGAIGNWTLYDPTGSTVYGYQSITVPNLGNPMAWMVFAPGSSQLSQSLTETQAAYNGNQMMASYCPDDATIASDHWLISPLLSGDQQTISFFARELTDQYGAETFEVLYSTTDNNPASFTLAESLSSSSTDWAQFTAQLPAGAKYFAIRHTSTDVFALFVDDITYIPEPVGPVSYNIYLDGQLVDNVPGTTFSYTFNNVSNGAHQCAVSAVYDLGESVAVPATFTMAQETTLAHLVSNGVVDGMYKISNDLVGGKVTWDDNRQMFAIFAKDNKAYANKRAPSEGQETYLINYQNGDFSNTVEQEDYDQSNWIEILIPSDLTGIASKSANPNAYTNKLRELQDEFEGLILPGGSIEGKYLDALNPSIEYYPTELPVAGSTSAYTPNIYTPANFLMENIDADGAKSYRDDELGNQYFFMMDAKPQEMALVVWCFYPGNGDYFYLPARVGDEVNGHQFHGNFKASMALCEDYNIDKNTTINSNVFEASDKDGTGINQVKLYGFNAVVRKNPAYWTPGNGAPRRADAVITPYTDGVEPTPAYIVYPLNAGATSTGTVTSVTERMATSIVVSTTYVNAQGLQSDKPFDGVNIVVTRYSDGSTRTTKVVKH